MSDHSAAAMIRAPSKMPDATLQLVVVGLCPTECIALILRLLVCSWEIVSWPNNTWTDHSMI